MAKKSKPKVSKTKHKGAPKGSKGTVTPKAKPVPKLQAKTAKPKLPASKIKPKGMKKEAEASEPISVAAGQGKPAKKAADALIQTLKRRQEEKQSGDGKERSAAGGIPRPKGKRGRRPKRPVEYTPTHGEEEEEAPSTYTGIEPDYERIEHDTGLQIRQPADEFGFSLDRFDDGEEELNFDS